MNWRLLPYQQIKDYYSKIMGKGNRIHKTAKDILLKFIEGLPPQLAFFVRDWNPEDILAALIASKLGEAYSYRASLHRYHSPPQYDQKMDITRTNLLVPPKKVLSV